MERVYYQGRFTKLRQGSRELLTSSNRDQLKSATDFKRQNNHRRQNLLSMCAIDLGLGAFKKISALTTNRGSFCFNELSGLGWTRGFAWLRGFNWLRSFVWLRSRRDAMGQKVVAP